MGLKQSIVVVNEYTIKNKSGKGGSRGGTPGDYVLRYMARKGAVEDLSPIQFDAETYIQRYMARDSATDYSASVPELKDNMKKIDGNGGVAFGYGDFSLSHKKLKQSSDDIQHQFEKGKTVFKTIISFDEEYLREHKIISDDFQFKERGDYRGNIDQMKMRMAIMNGLEKMSRSFDDLRYIGVIQVDTAHVHCHLAMVDAGVGNLTKDGTQKGKLTAGQMDKLRYGINDFLKDKEKVHMMNSNFDHDKRNALYGKGNAFVRLLQGIYAHAVAGIRAAVPQGLCLAEYGAGAVQSAAHSAPGRLSSCERYFPAGEAALVGQNGAVYFPGVHGADFPAAVPGIAGHFRQRAGHGGGFFAGTRAGRDPGRFRIEVTHGADIASEGFRRAAGHAFVPDRQGENRH